MKIKISDVILVLLLLGGQCFGQTAIRIAQTPKAVFTHNSKWLFVATTKEISVYHAATGNLNKEFITDHPSYDLALTPDDLSLFVASRLGKIYRWNLHVEMLLHENF